VRLFAGDDWAEDHHDIEVMDEAGKVLAKRRLPEGAAGMTQLHALIGRFLPEDADDAEVVTGIETDELLPGMFEPVREHLARELGGADQ